MFEQNSINFSRTKRCAANWISSIFDAERIQFCSKIDYLYYSTYCLNRFYRVENFITFVLFFLQFEPFCKDSQAWDSSRGFHKVSCCSITYTSSQHRTRVKGIYILIYLFKNLLGPMYQIVFDTNLITRKGIYIHLYTAEESFTF